LEGFSRLFIEGIVFVCTCSRWVKPLKYSVTKPRFEKRTFPVHV